MPRDLRDSRFEQPWPAPRGSRREPTRHPRLGRPGRGTSPGTRRPESHYAHPGSGSEASPWCLAPLDAGPRRLFRGRLPASGWEGPRPAGAAFSLARLWLYPRPAFSHVVRHGRRAARRARVCGDVALAVFRLPASHARPEAVLSSFWRSSSARCGSSASHLGGPARIVVSRRASPMGRGEASCAQTR